MEAKYYEHVEKFRIIKSKGINYYAHFHEQMEVVYCLNETIHATVEGKDYELFPGDLIMVFPSQRHCYVNSKMEKPEKAIVLVFNPIEIEEYAYELTSMVPETPVLRKEQLPELFPSLLESFYRDCQEPVDMRRLKAYTAVVVSILLECSSMKSVEQVNDSDMTQRILAYLNENYKKSLTIQDVSKALGISSTAISGIFIKRMDTTFIMYVNSIRVRRAKKLLRSTNQGMKEIAVQSGFKSQRTFFRIFQEICEMTPGEYRKRNREEMKRKYGENWKLTKPREEEN